MIGRNFIKQMVASNTTVYRVIKMQRSLLLFLALLSACADQGPSGFSSAQPGVNVARAALAAGSPEMTLTVVNGILEREPRNLAALVAQGDALSVLGRSDEAGISYAKALALNPGFPGAEMGMARLQLRTDPAQAQLLFLDVLQQEPRNAAALNNLGIAYDLQGNHSAAQGAYRQALAADPSMRAAEVNLALSLALSGEAATAVRMLTPMAMDANASQRLRHDLAAALAMAGDKAAAARLLNGDLTQDQIERALLAYGSLRR